MANSRCQWANVGKVCVKIAQILRGKHKVNYTPHMDMGDFVVVINAEKILVTGNKENQKMYFKHTGYPGGTRDKFSTFTTEES